MVPFGPQCTQSTFRLEPDLAATCQTGADGVGIEDRHDPPWHANFQDSRPSFVGEERVLVPCGHFWGARAAGAPIADDGREAFRRREAPRSRFPVVRVGTIGLDRAGSPECRPVVENSWWEIG